MTPFNASATDERTANFVTEYQTRYNEIPNQFAADGYDCIYAIYEACQKAGVTADMSHEDICDALIATFTSSDFSVDGLTGSGMTWAATGEVSKAPHGAVEVEDGVYVARMIIRTPRFPGKSMERAAGVPSAARVPILDAWRKRLRQTLPQRFSPCCPVFRAHLRSKRERGD